MNYESQWGSYEYRPQPEYFNDVNSLDELHNKYDIVNQKLVNDHSTAFPPIVETHKKYFTQELYGSGSWDIDTILENTDNNVLQVVSPAAANVEAVLTEARNKAATLMQLGDTIKLRKLYHFAKEYGVNSQEAYQQLNRASTEPARRAMQICLDADTLKWAQTIAGTYGVGSDQTEQMLKGASSRSARLAMRTALDHKLLSEVLQSANHYGAYTDATQQLLRSVSSQNVYDAFRATLDKQVLNHANTNARVYGTDSQIIANILRGASSDTVRRVLARKLQEDDAASRRNNQYYYNHQSGYQSNQNFNYREFFGKSFRDSDYYSEGARHRQNGNTNPPPYEKPASGEPQKHIVTDPEVQGIIAKVVARNRTYSWLQREEPIDVRRVVQAVYNTRRKAAMNNETITDREMYLRYRKQADKGELDGKDRADPIKLKSFQIYDAMMNGNIDGKLPF